MENILIWLFYHILVPVFILGVAINIHEFGHFIVARLFGMRVEAYSFFGLGPRIWGFKRGNTDYRISAIPLGAYVKLYGDEATASLEGGESDGEVVPESELYELRPRWQKFFVMIGGPFMNVMLALAIPFFGGLINGVPGTPPPVVAEIRQDSATQKSGLQVGDRIVSFNGTENPSWGRIQNDSLISPDKPIPAIVERKGEKIPVQITPRKEIMPGGQEVGVLEFQPDMGVSPTVVGAVEPNTPAAEAGMQTGDVILEVNGETLRSPQQLGASIQDNKAAPIKLLVERNGQQMELTAQARQLPDGKTRLGFGYGKAEMPLEKGTVSSAAALAFDRNWEVLRTTGAVLGQVFSGKRSAQDSGVAGPVGIFQQSAEAAKIAGWQGVLFILMAISLSLGVFNLLPIPLLDGGQIVVLGIEGILSLFGKTLSNGIKEKIQLVGLGIILLLMIGVFFLDFSRIAKSFSAPAEKPAASSTK